MKKLMALFATGLMIVLLSTSCFTPQSGTSQTPQPTTPQPVAKALYPEAVATGVEYFKKQAAVQLSLTEKLLDALKGGDLAQAKEAYINARPPYEEIEVYALSFEQEDTDIDARPYAIDGGETSPEFRSFHRVEALLFRDGDTKAAIPYTEGLVKTVKSLIQKLDEPANFNAALNFQGMLNLATEVPAKKISSEEETWSDQSLLIFKHNWIGIQSQFEPYKSKLSAELVAEVENAYQQCLNTVKPFFNSGKIAAKPYSTLSVEQRGAIVTASYRYRDALSEAMKALKIPEPA
ncbi:MAG: EfeM/EfeO family lipoprotein [Leptolyngbyaceae cyanobacterium SU_3_3]|nr:EfeM/EfeO family lipoprotein [Leptolyngbyaceae cyanobacterium SU_3_3]NJR51342.1 EfeM/EfeO family lipoprotein [Leptolyngbyaceae cyanobacterium CSU_1_3]